MIANISGNPIPMDIVVKDRYTQEWAMTNTGKLLWTYSGITGHYNVPFDMNGDGKDEMFTGYVVLDQTGKAKYPDPIAKDHPDNIWIGDVDGNPANGVEVVYGLAQQPSIQCVSPSSNGKVLWTNSDMTEAQQVILADYRPDLPGLETYGLDRTVRSSLDSLFLIDSSGKTLWKETGTNGGGGTAIKPIPNWDGTNTPMVLAFKRGSAQVWNGQTKMVHKMPMDGNAMVGDFGGDDKTEVLMYSKTTANIYGIAAFDYNTPAPNPGHPMKQTRQNYNWSRYGSSDVWAFTAVPSAGDGGVVPTPTGGAPAAGGTTGSTGGTTGSTGGTTGSTGGTTGSTGGRSGTTSTGGAPATGGVAATGGIISSTGGSTARGGAGGVATGGSPATGGTIAATGGTTSAGGVVSTGGTAAATGGSPSVTGGVATGGAPSSGGVISTGGIPASGGTSGSPIAGTGGTGTNKATGNAGGCSCRVAGSRSESSILASLGFLGLVMLRSLRRRRSR
jgi:MYXO-CTERM domain-containing protein